jgi:uncharacterized protein
MGAVGEAGAPGNVWRTAKDWPPPHTPTSLYLHGDGALSWKAPIGESGSTSYKSDPFTPMQIPGAAFPGAKDARPFEKQPEVRTFTTAPLDKPMEWTGRVRAELSWSSTARDTDVIVRVPPRAYSRAPMNACSAGGIGRSKHFRKHSNGKPRIYDSRAVSDEW